MGSATPGQVFGLDSSVNVIKAAHKRLLVLRCLVAEHCWDPVRLSIVEYAPRFKRLTQAKDGDA